jgi:sterol 3beta-glucosyltransferase
VNGGPDLRIAIQTFGTRGDVQPYIALALGLIKAGFEVQLAAPVQFAAMVSEYGVPFAPLPGELLALIDTPAGKSAIVNGQGFGAGFKLLKHVRPLMRQLLDAEWTAVGAFAPHAIIYHPKSLAAPHMAQRLGCPAILASPLPGFTPTSAFPSPLFPFANLGPLNRVSHAVAIKGAGLLFGKAVREWRSTSLGLPRRGAAQTGPAGTLYAYSPNVVPRPADWGDNVSVGGYWFLDTEAWRPDANLAAFLEAGEPPVYVGFGSMPGIDPDRMTELVVEGLAQAGARGLLAIGGGALAARANTPSVHVITGAPHDKLFPYVGATIHHGGAGTTAAGLRAGKPTVACPFFGDQPFWGRRIAQLGVGPSPLNRKALSPESIAGAITAMRQREMRERATALGAAIRGEDGVGSAVAFIDRVVARGA